MKEEVKSHWKTWIFYFSLVVFLIVVYKAIDSIGYIMEFIKGLLGVLSPFLAGLLISYLLYIPERKIEETFKNSKNKFLKKKARGLGILCTYIIFLLIIMILINFILPVVIESVNELINNFQTYYSRIIGKYNELPENSLLKNEKVYDILKEIQNIDFKQYFSLANITGYVKGAFSVATGIFDVFVAFIVSIYILAERTEIIGFIKKLCKVTFKENTYKRIEKYFDCSNHVFIKFVSSQFIDALIVGSFATIAMKIIGVKYSTLLGFIIGLFNMIPYFGAIIAVVFACLVTIITGGISQAIIMLITIIILQQIDANIINPKIIGESLQISPLAVIFAVTVGGAYFGVIGMFLGVPVIAVINIALNDYIDNNLKRIEE